MIRRALIISAAAVCLLLAVPSVWATDRDPTEIPLRQYGFILALSLLGGVVSWYAKVRSGQVQGWNITHLVGELATSAFAGLIAFWLCSWADVPQLVSAALVGMSGHMGAKAIAFFEDWAKRRFEGIDPAAPTSRS